MMAPNKVSNKRRMKELSKYFHKMSEFLTLMEEQNPIPMHPHLFDQWEKDVYEYLEDILELELSIKEKQVPYWFEHACALYRSRRASFANCPPRRKSARCCSAIQRSRCEASA